MWNSLLVSLRHRPLLWIAPAIVFGCVLGPLFAGITRARNCESLILLLPLALGLGFLFSSYRSWCSCLPDRARLALFLALIGIVTTHAARRVLPPTRDISELVHQAVPPGPQHPVPVLLKGWVADFPERSDFNLTFPLECATINTDKGTQQELSGRVWVKAPLDAQVEVGDAISLRTELVGLPRVGNVGERDLQMRYIAANCWCLAQVKDNGAIRVLQAGHSYPVERWIALLRRKILAHYEAAFSGSPVSSPSSSSRLYPYAMAQLLAAMVFGQGGLQEPLPFLTRHQFRAAGLSHVLVASGAQVAFLTLILIGVARAVGLRRWWLIAVVLPILLLYALLTGGGPSIYRATIAGLCIAWALLLGRDVDGLSLWSLALVLILLLDPLQIFSISLQLTFAATWGLLVIAPAIGHLLEHYTGARHAETQTAIVPTSNPANGQVGNQSEFKLSRVNQLLSLSLGAQVATTPLLLYHFGRISAAGIGANFVAVPLAGLLVTTGILGLILTPINALNFLLIRSIAGVAAAASAAPGAQTETSRITLPSAILIYALLLLAASPTVFNSYLDRQAIADEIKRWWQKRRDSFNGFRVAGILTGFILLSTAYSVWHTLASNATLLRLTLLDVGQGESIIIRAPSGRTVVIDGGSSMDEGRGEVGRAIIVPYLQSVGVRKIDALVITHSDADHCNALPTVIRELPLGLAIDGSLPHNTSANTSDAADHAKTVQALRQRNIPIHTALPGQKLHLGDDIGLTVIAPTEPRLQGDNNNGVVLRLDYGTTSMLLTGDIERAAEERLVRRGANLRCTVLKLAHHGSKTSSSPLFLAAAAPQAAILSCGRYNKYGHPAAEVMKRLEQRRISVFRTDRDGAIEVSSDGRSCWIQPFR